MRTRKRVHYTGRVQGVGFRWTSRTIAERFPVSGWVKNLPDGRVEMLVEGEETSVDAYLAAVLEHFGGNVTDRQVISEEPGDLSGPLDITFQ